MGRVGIVISYPLEQQLFGISQATLEASAKIAILLSGEVVLSYSSILASELTYGLVRTAEHAVRRGLISVDRRSSFQSFAALAAENPEKSAASAHAREAIAFLDATVSRVVPFDDLDLSGRYAANIKNLGYLIERQNPDGANIQRLQLLLTEIDAKRGIGLEWTIARLKALGYGQVAVDCAALVYHFLGGLSVEASGSWPEQFNRTLMALRSYQDSFIHGAPPPSREVELFKRHKLFGQEDYQSLVTKAADQSINCDFDELPHALRLDPALIRALSWEAIVDLATSREARAVQSMINEYQHGVDADGRALIVPSSLSDNVAVSLGNLANVIRSEAPKRLLERKALERATDTMTLASILGSGLGFVVSPTVGSVLAIGGLCLTISQALVEKYRNQNYSRIASLGDKIALASSNA